VRAAPQLINAATTIAPNQSSSPEMFSSGSGSGVGVGVGGKGEGLGSSVGVKVIVRVGEG